MVGRRTLSLSHFSFVISSESKCEFLSKLQRSYKESFEAKKMIVNVLDEPGTNQVTAGNWIFTSSKASELSIKNKEGEQVGDADIKSISLSG